MTFVVIFLCLAIQRYWQFENFHRRYQWVDRYGQWLLNTFHLGSLPAWLITVVLLLPIPIVLLVVMSIASSALGGFGAFIVDVVVLWFCVDYALLNKKQHEVTIKELLIRSFERLFAIIFWFGLLGVFGASLYLMICGLQATLESHVTDEANAQAAKDEEQPHVPPQTLPAVAEKKLSDKFRYLQGLMDWAPLRVMGLSFALVGEFSSTFKIVSKQFFTGITSTHRQAVLWVATSLHLKLNDDETIDEADFQKVADLVNRTLVVWLVVIALINVGVWIG